MTQTERLAPHGGCNWEGCKECFPEQKAKTTTNDKSVMYVVQRKIVGQAWEDFSEWLEKDAAFIAMNRGKMRTGSSYVSWRILSRVTFTTVTDRIIS